MPIIGVTKVGAFNIGVSASRILNISEGDKAVFFQDEIDRTRWFIAVGQNGDYPLRPKNIESFRSCNESYVFSSIGLKHRIGISLSMQGNESMRFKVNPEPIEIEGKKLYELKLIA